MENLRFVDIFPIGTGVFPLLLLVYWRVSQSHHFFFSEYSSSLTPAFTLDILSFDGSLRSVEDLFDVYRMGYL